MKNTLQGLKQPQKRGTDVWPIDYERGLQPELIASAGSDYITNEDHRYSISSGVVAKYGEKAIARLSRTQHCKNLSLERNRRRCCNRSVYSRYVVLHHETDILLPEQAITWVTEIDDEEGAQFAARFPLCA